MIEGVQDAEAARIIFAQAEAIERSEITVETAIAAAVSAAAAGMLGAAIAEKVPFKEARQRLHTFIDLAFDRAERIAAEAGVRAP